MKELHTFDKRLNKNQSSPNRLAVRAVILKDDSIFLIHLKATDEFKFPGGGVEENETLLAALTREVLEESGAYITNVIECIGYIDQIYPDIYNPNEIFYMRSIYYLCEISDIFTQQSLSNYEVELDFSPFWVNINQAIRVNTHRNLSNSKHHWTERELWMLEYLMKTNIIAK